MDKRNGQYEEGFVERAWADMNEILDREMPVKNKRRRPLVIWLFFGLFLLGGAIIFTDVLKVNNVEVEDNMPIAANKVKSSNDLLITPDVEKPMSSNVIETALEKEDDQDVTGDMISTNYITTPRSEPEIASQDVQVVTKEERTIEIVNELDAKQEHSYVETPSTERENDSASPLVNVVSLDRLKLRGMCVEYSGERAVKAIPVSGYSIISPVEKMGKGGLSTSLLLSLNSSVSTNGELYGYGLKTGLEIGVSRKWSLLSSVMFHRHHSFQGSGNADELDGALIESESPDPNTDDNESTGAGSGVTGNEQDILQIEDLHMASFNSIVSTIALNYSVTEAIDVYAGYSWRHITTNAFNFSDNQNPANQAFEDLNNRFSFHRNLFNPTMGLRISLSDRFVAGVEYEYFPATIYREIDQTQVLSAGTGSRYDMINANLAYRF